jgi:hypothetical protein
MAVSIGSWDSLLNISLPECLAFLSEQYGISRTDETKTIFRAAIRLILPDVFVERLVDNEIRPPLFGDLSYF